MQEAAILDINYSVIDFENINLLREQLIVQYLRYVSFFQMSMKEIEFIKTT